MSPTGAPPFHRRLLTAARRLRGRGRQALKQGGERAKIAGDFDRDFYLARNPDVAASGMDAADHFLRFGWREGRDPRPDFSVADYLALNPDVAAAGMNPFLHYVTAGRAEGRSAKSDLGFRYRILAGLKPLADRLAEADAARFRGEVVGAEALRAAMARSRGERLHISFSHDDFERNVGGLQLCVQREAQAYAETGVDHLHVFPAKPYPALRTGADAALVGVIWNRELVGYITPGEVAAALTARSGGFAIHSLLGLSVDDVLAILAAARMSEGVFWLHDFASLCAGFHLMRDDVEDCGAPPPDSGACSVCVYGQGRALHLSEHGRLFHTLSLTVAAPSQSALDTWRGGWGHPHRGAVVVPHARLVPQDEATPPAEGPLQVAFLGAPVAHKGWPVFQALAERFADDPRYAFHHLGAVPGSGTAHSFEEVAVSAARPDAMREALERIEVEAAVVWSLCRETFSLTAYEAAAAGAAVLTGPDSGNVAQFVRDQGHGRVLADEAALTALFESGEVIQIARKGRRRYALAFSRMSAELET